MSMDDDEIPKGASPEHIRFMNELVENVKAMTGGQCMVAAIGNEPNGIYCIMLATNPLPAELVMQTIMVMLGEKILQELGRQYNAHQVNVGKGSEYVN